MSCVERGSGDLDWEEPAGRPHSARKKAARTADARIIVDRLGWTSRPWVYSANLRPTIQVDVNPASNWSDNLESAEEILARRLQRQAAGAFAVSIRSQETTKPAHPSMPATQAAEYSFPDSVRRLNPSVLEILPLGPELIAIGSHKLTESRRFYKTIPDLVGEVSEWTKKQELALRDAREVVDTVQQRLKQSQVTPEMLVLESSCLWIGSGEQRPSLAIASAELLAATNSEMNRPRSNTAPPTWLAAAHALLGQRRVQRKSPAAYAGWYRCGKLLPAWPLDVLIHVARKVGGPHQLADQIDAEPEMASATAAALMKELLLTADSSTRPGSASTDDRLAQTLLALPAFLSICKRLEAEPTRRLNELIEIQRQAIDDAIAVTGATGDIVRFTPAAEPNPQTARRDEFFRHYFQNIASATGAPPVIPRKAVDPTGAAAVTRRHLRCLHQLLAAAGLGSGAMGVNWEWPTGDLFQLDRQDRRLLTRINPEESAAAPLNFENLAGYACGLLWNAGEAYARALTAPSWQTDFLIAAARVGCLVPGAAAGVAQWVDACCAIRAPGADGHEHLRVVIAGLVTTHEQAGKAHLDENKRAIAFGALGRHAAKLLKHTVIPGIPLTGRGVKGIRFICAAVAAGMDADQIERTLHLKLVAAVEALLALQPRKLPGLLDFVDRLLRDCYSGDHEGQYRIVEEWHMHGPAAPGWGVAFALYDAAAINRYFDLAQRLSELPVGSAYAWDGPSLMQWIFGIVLPGYFPFDVDAFRAAGGQCRAKASFLARHSEHLLRRGEEFLARKAASINENSDADADPPTMELEHCRQWQRCVEIACEWADLGLSNPLGAFDRLLRQSEASPDSKLFELFSSQPLRALLRVCDGDPGRAAVLGSVRLDLSWDESEQIGKAWDCIEQLTDLRRFIAGLAGSRDSAVRAVRWLSRLGFCLRLQGEARLRDKLAAAWSGSGQRADDNRNPLPAGLDIPPEILNDVQRLRRLRGDGSLPKKVSDIVSRPDDLAEELRGLEARRGSLFPAAAARVENLREKLANRSRLQQWMADDLTAALPEQLFRELERTVRELTAGHLRKIIGPLPPTVTDSDDEGRNWDNAARLYFSVSKNRKALKRLLSHEARGNRQWLADFAPNRQFLDKIASLGVDTGAWLGARVSTAATPLGVWKLELETNPLEVLRMGNYFGTCLSEGHANAFATVANACDANKRVIYVRDERRNVIGRKLLILTPEAEILGFRSYGLGPLDPNKPSEAGSSPWMKVLLHCFCRELADACHARLHPFPAERPGHGDPTSDQWLSLTTHWYNDGPEPFDPFWLTHNSASLRRAIVEKSSAFDALLMSLCDEGSDEALAQSLRAIVFLNEEAVGLVQAFVDAAGSDGRQEGNAQIAPRVSEDRMAYVLSYIARYSLPGGLREFAQTVMHGGKGRGE